MKIGSRTPWGKADSVRLVAPGIWSVGTPSHGGFKLDSQRNAQVHAAWRCEGGWYEEDCRWAIVAITFPDAFPGENREQAVATAKQYQPDEYTRVTGEPVLPAESRVLRERAFLAEVATRYVAVAAWGEWHPAVPKGQVGVWAVKGGDRASTDGKYFLIPAVEYAQRGTPFGVVIDEARDAAWEREKLTTKVAEVKIVNGVPKFQDARASVSATRGQ